MITHKVVGKEKAKRLDSPEKRAREISDLELFWRTKRLFDLQRKVSILRDALRKFGTHGYVKKENVLTYCKAEDPDHECICGLHHALEITQ